MALVDKKLTELTEKISAPDTAWVHFVDPTDISQSPEGSSYKIKRSNFIPVPVFNPEAYDLTEFTNLDVDRFARLSDLGGGGSSSQYVRMYSPLWSDGTINTWQSWAKGSNILSVSPNITLGTGSVPNAAISDSCFIMVPNGVTSLSQVFFSTDNSYSIKNYQIFIQSFNLVNGDGVGAETNIQTLINESVTTGGGNIYTFKDNFTIAAHTLGTNTGLRIAFRYTGGGVVFQVLSPQILFKFD